MAFRAAKVASLVNRIVSDQLRRVLPNLYVAITDVEVSPDLKHAIIWIRALSTEELDEQKLEMALAERQPAIQKALAQQFQAKFTPKINFRLDKGAKHAEEIERLTEENRQDSGKSLS